MKILVVGCGRAGLRHIKTLKAIEPGSYVLGWDPAPRARSAALQAGADEVGCHEMNHYRPIGTGQFDGAVVATPPDLHIREVWRAVKMHGIFNVLCEKPLCGWGQLEQVDDLEALSEARIMMALNWRWHPAVAGRRGQAERVSLLSVMWRADFPHWGIILDHLPHSVDIVRQLLGEDDLGVHKAQAWVQNGVDLKIEVEGPGYDINDSAVCPRERLTRFWLDDGPVGVTLEPVAEMYEGMTRHFFNVCRGQAEPQPTLADGIALQRVLERIGRAAGVGELPCG